MECDVIHEFGGHILRITRPGVGPCNSDVTEQPLDDSLVDFEIVNMGDLDDLRETVKHALTLLGGRYD